MTEPIVRLEGVRKRYGTHSVLSGIDLTVSPGSLVSVLGPSGCGKTTLLRVIAGLVPIDGGHVWIRGRLVDGLGPQARDVAVVFQNYALFPHLTVADNVAYGLRVRRRPRAEVAARVADLLRLMRLSALAARPIAGLSGGEQQRVALARALSLRPAVLLLDEPFSNIDAHLRLSMRDELKRLQQELAQTMVLVTHDQEEALTLSDRVVMMGAGTIAHDGLPQEIYERPASASVASFVGRVNLVPARVEAVTPGGAVTLGTPFGPHHAVLTPSSWSAGADVVLVVRPETVRLLDPASDPEASLAVVARASYAGATVLYRLEAGSGTLNVEAFDPSTHGLLQPGQKVALRLPDRIYALPPA